MSYRPLEAISGYLYEGALYPEASREDRSYVSELHDPPEAVFKALVKQVNGFAPKDSIKAPKFDPVKNMPDVTEADLTESHRDMETIKRSIESWTLSPADAATISELAIGLPSLKATSTLRSITNALADSVPAGVSQHAVSTAVAT
eukprot:6126152-Prymnesium_polylepis.2